MRSQWLEAEQVAAADGREAAIPLARPPLSHSVRHFQALFDMSAMKCTNCGFTNTSRDSACVRCHGALGESDPGGHSIGISPGVYTQGITPFQKATGLGVVLVIAAAITLTVPVAAVDGMSLFPLLLGTALVMVGAYLFHLESPSDWTSGTIAGASLAAGVIATCCGLARLSIDNSWILLVGSLFSIGGIGIVRRARIEGLVVLGLGLPVGFVMGGVYVFSLFLRWTHS